MSIYDVDYATQVRNLASPRRRKPRYLAWLDILMKPLQWRRDRFFNDYYNPTGVMHPKWIAGPSYSFGDMVHFIDVTLKVGYYYSLKNNNLSAPTDASSWLQIQDDYVGVFERIRFNNNKLCIEYILNKYFQTNFVQPAVGLSDIYITDGLVSATNLISGLGTARYSPTSSYAYPAYVNYNGRTFICPHTSAIGPGVAPPNDNSNNSNWCYVADVPHEEFGVHGTNYYAVGQQVQYQGNIYEATNINAATEYPGTGSMWTLIGPYVQPRTDIDTVGVDFVLTNDVRTIYEGQQYYQQSQQILFKCLADTEAYPVFANAVPTTRVNTSYWEYRGYIVNYSSSVTYYQGSLVMYNGYLYVAVVSGQNGVFTFSGQAPSGTISNNGYWHSLNSNVTVSYTGFVVNIPVAVYNAAGGTNPSPNPPDAFISELLKRYTLGRPCRIQTY